MKRFVTKLSIAIVGLVSLMCICSCSKDDDDDESMVYYKLFGLEDMLYIEAEEQTATKFFYELGNVMDKYDGRSYISESSLKSDINKVVNKYNKGVVSGTFYLKKSTNSMNGPWSQIKSWTMQFASKYTRAKGEKTAELGLTTFRVGI